MVPACRQAGNKAIPPEAEIMIIYILEAWQSGLMRCFRKAMSRKGPRVRILPPPPMFILN